MQFLAVQGMIERRILVNYRAAPSALARLLPPPFRPQLVGEYGVAGICLIRLKSVRPRFVPACLGIDSENAAHRIAVEWDAEGRTERGVFIARRDTSSAMNTWAGGRMFPGLSRRAQFTVDEQLGRYKIAIHSADDAMHLSLSCEVADWLPRGSVFSSLAAASEFFANGSIGYSPCAGGTACEGLELKTFGWNMRPLSVSRVESSFFDDRHHFPAGSIEFDSALLMERIAHQWRRRPTLDAAATGAPAVAFANSLHGELKA